MARDLREYLDGCGGALWRVAEPLSVVQEITALQHLLSQAGRYPALLVERPRLADGKLSAMPVVTNLFASRERVAALLGLADHRRSASAFARLAAAPARPVTVAGRSRCSEIVESDLRSDAAAGAAPARPRPRPLRHCRALHHARPGERRRQRLGAALRDPRAARAHVLSVSLVAQRAQRGEMGSARRALSVRALDRPPSEGGARRAGEARPSREPLGRRGRHRGRAGAPRAERHPRRAAQGAGRRRDRDRGLRAAGRARRRRAVRRIHRLRRRADRGLRGRSQPPSRAGATRSGPTSARGSKTTSCPRTWRWKAACTRC